LLRQVEVAREVIREHKYAAHAMRTRSRVYKAHMRMQGLTGSATCARPSQVEVVREVTSDDDYGLHTISS
jgi:hypothetical protein